MGFRLVVDVRAGPPLTPRRPGGPNWGGAEMLVRSGTRRCPRKACRLARATRDLLNTLATIPDRKAGFRSLGDTWADTTTAHGRLMLTVLGGLAEFERELIRARAREGRRRAVARGVKMGRKPKLTPHQMKEAIRRRDRGEEALREIARSYNVSHRRFRG